MINVVLKPEKGIQIDETKKYLFDPAISQAYDDLAKDWATKTDGLVESEDYSSKAYAIGGTGTETNNSKYYSEQAATSATNASTSETNAGNSATTATTKAGEASASATIATTQAGIATTKANSASNSATTATTQAGIATSKAGAAATSATSAGISETNAGNSATSASNSANSASASASLAQNWATKTDGTVDGVEYSAKYYAEQAAQQAIPSQTGHSGEYLTTDGSSMSWNAVVGALPSQTGQSGKYLTTDGTDASWANVDALPSQTGQSGKFLATDGTDASWTEVYPNQSDNAGKFLTTDGSVASWSEAVDYTNITNCITEIPQDIKLELNNGTLTLKAGSKVYVPNGFEEDGVTPKFDVVVIESDKTCLGYTAGTCIAFINDNGDLYASVAISPYTGSGSSAPTDFIGLFYNTTTNTIGVRFDTSSQFSSGYSLPIAIVTNSSTTVCSSIDQVFNGFGYIGSTVFALPGVKGLIPDGRNADGSLRNIGFVVDKVKTTTYNSGYSSSYAPIVLAVWGLTYWGVNTYYGGSRPENPVNYVRWYSEEENLWYEYVDGWNVQLACAVGISVASAGKVTSFTPKLPFHAVDRNDSSWVSTQAMPSGKYIDLTLGASGSTYTAPANGWFALSKSAGVATGHITLEADNYAIEIRANANGNNLRGFIPIVKGKPVKAVYSATGTTNYFRFIYAEGDK